MSGVNSQLVIAEHFDSIVNELDIYVEDRLERDSKQLGGKQLKEKNTTVRKQTRRENEMNSIRASLIDEIRRVEESALRFSGDNRETIKRRLQEVGEKINEINNKKELVKREVFSNIDSCFMIYLNRDELRSTTSRRSTFDAFLVIVDRVYLDESGVKFIRDRIHKRDPNEFQVLDERCVRKYMLLGAIEAQMSSLKSNVMRVEIGPMCELEKLVLANQKIVKIDFTDSSMSFQNLKHLDLRKNKLERIEPHLWSSKLSQVETLILSSNKLDLSREQDSSFELLTNLKSLHLDLNRIPRLESHVLAKNTRLEKLSLMHVYLTEIEPDSMHALTSLRDLELSANSLTHIHPSVFAYSTGLKYLRLHSNRLEHLENGTFSACHSLESLSLSSNSLVRLESDCFVGLTSLIELNLSENRLDRIDPRWFVDLMSLKTLDLSSNQLVELPKSVFRPLASLESLKLFKNGLVTVESGMFEGLTRLTRLILRENKLQQLAANVLDGLGELERIDVSANRLTHEALTTFTRSLNESVLVSADDQKI